MLRHVSNGLYLEAIRMAERTVLHVEVLFATIDDLEWQFALLGVKGMLPSFQQSVPHWLLQERHTSENLVCSAESWLIYSHYSRALRKRAHGGWA
jgi:hypothetical protein